MTVHVFRARVQSMVAGMNDTVIVTSNLSSVREAFQDVLTTEGPHDARIQDKFWPNRDRAPAHSQPEYLGELAEIFDEYGQAVNLSEVDSVSDVEVDDEQ